VGKRCGSRRRACRYVLGGRRARDCNERAKRNCAPHSTTNTHRSAPLRLPTRTVNVLLRKKASLGNAHVPAATGLLVRHITSVSFLPRGESQGKRALAQCVGVPAVASFATAESAMV